MQQRWFIASITALASISLFVSSIFEQSRYIELVLISTAIICAFVGHKIQYGGAKSSRSDVL